MMQTLTKTGREKKITCFWFSSKSNFANFNIFSLSLSLSLSSSREEEKCTYCYFEFKFLTKFSHIFLVGGRKFSIYRLKEKKLFQGQTCRSYKFCPKVKLNYD